MKHKKSSGREWGVKMLFNQRGEVLHEGKTLGEALLNIKSKRLESVVLDEQDVYPSKKKSTVNKQSGDLKFGMQLEKSRSRAVTREPMIGTHMLINPKLVTTVGNLMDMAKKNLLPSKVMEQILQPENFIELSKQRARELNIPRKIIEKVFPKKKGKK